MTNLTNLTRLTKLLKVQCTIHEMSFGKIRQELQIVSEQQDIILKNERHERKIDFQSLRQNEYHVRELQFLHQKMKSLRMEVEAQKIILNKARAKADMFANMEQMTEKRRHRKSEEERHIKLLDMFIHART